MMRTLIVWGAGRIGRGFVAPIFREGGWRVVFVDVDGQLVQRLNERGRYTIFRATVEGIAREVIEGGFTAVHTSDTHALETLFLQEGLMLDVAVHATELQPVAQMVAPLIRLRARRMPDAPLDILMNVNMSRPDDAFREILTSLFQGDAVTMNFLREKVGISGIAAACISPMANAEMFSEDPLALLNNSYPEQAISEDALRGEKPHLPRLRLSRDISGEETRKLYTLNMAHALLCYVALPLGYETVLDAMGNEQVRALTEQALQEACVGLKSALPFSMEELTAWKNTVIQLLLNPYINDSLRRLGADSRRKLARTDRLVGPALMCEAAGEHPRAIAKAIRAGYYYENDDEGTQAVRALVREQGLRAALQKISGLAEGEALTALILEEE